MLRITLISFLAFVAILFTVWAVRAPSYQDRYNFPPTPTLSLEESVWPEQKSQIKGKLFNRKDGKLLEGWVSVAGENDFRATVTDEYGEFTVSQLAEGSYQITAGAPGFHPSTFTSEANTEKELQLTLTPLPLYGLGPQASELSVPIREQTFSGFIRTESCASGIFSVVMIPQENEVPNGFYRTSVGADGFFQIPRIPEGLYDFRVLANDKSTDLDYFYFQKQVTVKTDPNENVMEVKTECMEILGTILIPPDQETLPMLPNPLPHTNAAVRLGNPQEAAKKKYYRTTITDLNGVFRFSNIPARKYSMEVLAPGYDSIFETIESLPGNTVQQKWLLQPKAVSRPTGQ